MFSPSCYFPPTPPYFFFYSFSLRCPSLCICIFFFYCIKRMCAGLCRLVHARTKRNNEFSAACPASDSFDIGFVSSGNGWWWAPELTLLSGFIPFYFLLRVPVCSLFFFFVVTYFNSNLVSSTPFYASNSFIFGFALARNGTCAPTHHDGITEQKLGASAGNALRVDCFFCWFPSIAKNRNQ